MKYFTKATHTNLISEKDPSIIDEQATRLAAKPRFEPKAYYFPIASKQPEASNFLPLSQTFTYFNQPLQSRDDALQYSDCLANINFYLREPFNAGFQLLVNTNNSLFSLRRRFVDFIEKRGFPPNIELEDFEFFYLGKSVDPHKCICEFLIPDNLNHIINVVFSRLAVNPVQKICVDPNLVPKSRFGGLLTLPNFSELSKM